MKIEKLTPIKVDLKERKVFPLEKCAPLAQACRSSSPRFNSTGEEGVQRTRNLYNHKLGSIAPSNHPDVTEILL